MSITTKRGDEGHTDLMFGRRVAKTHPRVSACGSIDELTAILGVVRAKAKVDRIRDEIARIQEDLIGLMGELATQPEDREKYREKGYQRVTDESVVYLSTLVEELESSLDKKFRGWSVPGARGNAEAAMLDVGRSVCRRAEREVCALTFNEEKDSHIPLRYLNRLSDALWLLARLEERSED